MLLNTTIKISGENAFFWEDEKLMIMDHCWKGAEGKLSIALRKQRKHI
jgi:hypothetical protein